MKTVRLLTVSKNKKHLIFSDAFNSDICRVQSEFDLFTDPISISENKEGLPKVYNVFLNNCRKDQVETAIMIHADVSFDYYSIMKHYLQIQNKYDIVGLAGTRKIELSISPLTWFTGSRNYPEERYGRVTHRQFNLGESFFNGHHHPNVKDVEVSTVDGLCFILNRNVIDSEARFDERFNFDFYDLDFCLTAITKNHLKIGTMVEPVIHESVGTSILRPEYLIEERKFREKWQLK